MPCEPTEAEVELHNRTHFPFRNWCPVCVTGRGVEDPHQASKEEKDGVPIVGFDYAYMNEGKGSKTELPIVVMKCNKSKCRRYDHPEQRWGLPICSQKCYQGH